MQTNTKVAQTLVQPPTRSYIRSIGVISVLVLCITLLLGAYHAFAYMAREYATDADFALGTLVARGGDGELVATTPDTANYLGAVVDASEEGVVVANSGAVSVLASDLDGDITSGDYVTTSRLPGIAAAWQPGVTTIGTALEPLDSTATDWQQRTARLSDGTSRQVNVARIEVELNHRAGSGDGSSSLIPAGIQAAAERIAGQPLATWRILLALAVGFGAILIASILLFSSARSSFFSLGRNPLAGDVIIKGLWKMVSVTTLIIAAGLALAYLILRVGS